MKYSVIALFVLALVTCNGNEEVKQENTPVKQERVVLTMEELAKTHVEKYCRCSKPLQEFVDRIKNGIDTLNMVEYNKQQAIYKHCFDPDGRIQTYTKSLSPLDKSKYVEMKDSLLRIICPEIIPGNQ